MLSAESRLWLFPYHCHSPAPLGLNPQHQCCRPSRKQEVLIHYQVVRKAPQSSPDVNIVNNANFSTWHTDSNGFLSLSKRGSSMQRRLLSTPRFANWWCICPSVLGRFLPGEFQFLVAECRQLAGTNQGPPTLLSESTECLWCLLVILASGNVILHRMVTQELEISLLSKCGGCGAKAIINLVSCYSLGFSKTRCIRDLT